MTQITLQRLRQALGPIDESKLAAIQASGAKLKDIVEAKALIDGNNGLACQGEQDVLGPVKQVFIILTGDNTSTTLDEIKGKLNEILLDPASHFDSPSDVLSDRRFSDPEKVEILRRWEYDASELSVAGDEGMPVSDADGAQLQEIMLALAELVDEVDMSRSPPTKQGGLDRRSVGKDKPNG